MTEAPAPSALRSFWNRRWCRRLTYLLATGAVLTGLGAWLVTRPSVDRWLIAKANAYILDETGLAFHAERLEVHPFEGRFLLHQVSWGGDMITVERVEAVVDFRSSLRLPRLKSLLLVAPRVLLDQARVARVHFRDHPPRKEHTKVILDRLELRDGQVRVLEPAWGLAKGEFAFRVDGRGGKPNELALTLQVPAMAIGEGRNRFQGEATFKAKASEQLVTLEQGVVRLGGNRTTLAGSYTFLTKRLATQAEGHLDLDEVQRLGAPAQPPTASGLVDFKARLDGALDRLAWHGTVHGTALRAKDLPLHPGTLDGAASGGPGLVRLEKLAWVSQDGKLDASGHWTAKDGARLDVLADQVPLAPVAGYTRTGFLKDLVARFEGKAHLPYTPGRLPRLDLLEFTGAGQFLQDGVRVGALDLTVQDKRLETQALDLSLPELDFHGKASAVLAKRGFSSVQAEGSVRTDANDVAGVLKVWDIGSHDAKGVTKAFDMEGQARIQATFAWTEATGIQLKGSADILQPRWHGARADRIQAGVSIDRNVLRVTDMELSKDNGRGWGDLWLTWAVLPPGADQIDMCYRVFRLPVHEGLKAADQGDLALQGTGSGWVRLHGPFGHILMEGRAVAEDAQVYGLRIPAVSSDFFMDITGERLRTMDTRAADSLEHLGHMTGAPQGALAVVGGMDMDLRRETWTASLKGNVDSTLLGLPGPRLQALVDGSISGPLVSPFGPLDLPTGTMAFTKGRLSQGDQTLEGLEGSAVFKDGHLALSAGLEGKPRRLLRLDALQISPTQMRGDLEVDLDPESADTAKLAARLTKDLLKDARLTFRASGAWGPKGLDWKGTLDQFSGTFDGFQLAQFRPGRVNGDDTGVDVDLALEGHALSAFRDAGPQLGAVVPIGPADAPTRLTVAGWLPFSQEGPLSVKLAGSADLEKLKTILDHLTQPGQYSLLADMRPGGTAQVDLNLGGTLGEASLDGTLELKGGRVSVRTYPQSIENLNFTAFFKGRDITIPETAPITGTLAQGDLKAWGKVTWELGSLPRYNMHARLDNFQFRDLPEGFELEGSLEAALDGNDLDGGTLSGRINAKRMVYHADINLQDLILASALGGSGGFSSIDPSDPLARIYLDLDLNLSEPWEFDTNLLKLQGRPKGAFKVMGNLTHPGLKGKMDFLPGGRLTNLIPAGDIVIERGAVEFKDPSSFNPNLDIQGRVEVPPYLVNLNITGTLDALQAIPSSTPSLRQDEIFTILVDPSAASSVGSTPGFSSQAAMNTGLASTGTGLLSSLALANFQERLRKAFNLDRVNVAVRSGTGSPVTNIILGTSFNLLGHRTPLVFSHLKTGEATTISTQVEWRFGNIVLQLGFSQTTADTMHPSGEIRHTWSPR